MRMRATASCFAGAWLMAVALVAPAAAGAAVLKATLITPDDDPRLERSRVERAYLGHPGGPLSDGLEVALEETKFELEAAGAEVALASAPAATLEAARAAAVAAEKSGAAVLLLSLIHI